MTEISFIPLQEVVQLADCEGLTAELVQQLARRDKLLVFADHPTLGMLIEPSALLDLATELKHVRSEAREQYISGYEAEQKYNISRVSLLRYRDRGIIRVNDNDLLYLEDVAFVTKLSAYVKPAPGRSLFPDNYLKPPTLSSNM